MNETDRYLGCLLGLATGDALGTTLEFQKPGAFTVNVRQRQQSPQFSIWQPTLTDDVPTGDELESGPKLLTSDL